MEEKTKTRIIISCFNCGNTLKAIIFHNIKAMQLYINHENNKCSYCASNIKKFNIKIIHNILGGD